MISSLAVSVNDPHSLAAVLVFYFSAFSLQSASLNQFIKYWASFLQLGVSSVSHDLAPAYLSISLDLCYVLLIGYIMMINEGTIIDWQILSGYTWDSGQVLALHLWFPVLTETLSSLTWPFDAFNALEIGFTHNLCCTTLGVQRWLITKEATNKLSTSWYMKTEQEWMYVFIL